MDRLTAELLLLDREHVWHPFTPMKQWREAEQIVVARAEREFLFDTEGRRYIDGVSSLWCNVHGHRVPEIDAAVRAQLEKVAHSTLLGLASEPSIRLAAEFARRSPAGLNKVFFSDSGASAVEVALKMAVGYWFHTGRPKKNRFIALGGAYHGDTAGSMSVGFSDLFHRPFGAMVFPVRWSPAPDAARWPEEMMRASGESPGMAMPGLWPSENPVLTSALSAHCLGELEKLLALHAEETAAIIIEPVMQGAAGMICQPAGFVRGVAELARKYDVLLIADEVATGFGRTGRMFACEHDGVTPDLLCLAKGITGGYLPLAATLATDRIEAAFCGELADRRTLYHGHTYTGNALGCAAALASLELFDRNRLIEHINMLAGVIRDRLAVLRESPHVLDVRQRGVMVGIELCKDRARREPFDFSNRTGAAVCLAMRERGLIIRPLGDVVVLMPIPAMRREVLGKMMDIVVETIGGWRW